MFFIKNKQEYILALFKTVQPNVKPHITKLSQMTFKGLGHVEVLPSCATNIIFPLLSIYIVLQGQLLQASAILGVISLPNTIPTRNKNLTSDSSIEKFLLNTKQGQMESNESQHFLSI